MVTPPDTQLLRYYQHNAPENSCLLEICSSGTGHGLLLSTILQVTGGTQLPIRGELLHEFEATWPALGRSKVALA